MKRKQKQNKHHHGIWGIFWAIPILILITACGMFLYQQFGILLKNLPEISINDASSPVIEIETEQAQNQQPEPTQSWECRAISDKTTACAHPADPRMSTVEELNTAINNFRGAHGLSQLTQNDTLCNIAQKRAQEQVEFGQLDGHAGFEKYGNEQNEYRELGEVLYGGVQPQYGVHIVEWGWARSLTGHREALLDPKWQTGCGGIAGYFAVYIFGYNP